MTLQLSKSWARWLFWFSLCLLMLPGVWALTVTLLASGLDCPLTGNSSPLCHRLGTSIEQSLQLNLNVLTLYLYSLGLPLWMILFLAYRSFRSWLQGVVVLSCIWWLPHAYTILGMVTTQLLTHDACQLYGGDCVGLGVEMGSTLLSQGTSLWLWFLSLPICMAASAVYIGFRLRHWHIKRQRRNGTLH